MRQIVKISLVLVFLIIVAGFSLNFINNYYEKRIHKYNNDIGYAYGLVEKNQGLILQEKSLKSRNNILIFGSSELSSDESLDPYHPSFFFKKKGVNLQVNLIGRGHSQSIIHAVDVGAIAETLKNKKIVYIISPQWFTEGLDPESFSMNFSELQFYNLMFNNNVSNNIKYRIASRITNLAGVNQEFSNIKVYSYLYTKNNLLSNTVLTILSPYYRIKYYLLTIKDKSNTFNILNQYKSKSGNSSDRKVVIDWEKEKKNAEDLGERKANNNNFMIGNEYYNEYIKDNLGSYKNSEKNSTFLASDEFNDLKLFLDICSEAKVHPLIINIPVQGVWYDYCGFNKNNRKEYYNKISREVKSYGFDLVDLSNHEYDKYFFKDIMHLGWKGWVYVNEAIYKYYGQDKK